MSITTQVISGDKITQDDLNLINEYRNIRLGRSSIWDHVDNNGFHERTFFLVKDDSQLVSFCTLRSISVYLDENEYQILGLQAVISIVQGKGYGKALMQLVKNYAHEHAKTVIGFCEKTNADFYRKSGLQVFDDGCEVFAYIQPDGKEYYDCPGDVIYLNGKDNFMSRVSKQRLKVKHYIPHW